METIAVFTTIDSFEKAQAIAGALVERELAACVQITPIESFYRWQGKTQHEQEFRLMAKTVADRYSAIEAAIRDLHTYELPAIYAMGTREVFEPYAEWVAENSTGAKT